VKGIAIYVEGGGDGRDGKAMLRQGFDALLGPQKTQARERRLGWKLVLCGGRGQTFEAFQHASASAGDEVVALLVDAEDAVADSSPSGRVAHLTKRDGWDFASLKPRPAQRGEVAERSEAGEGPAERVHLMTQAMEAWIVADPEALSAFYGNGFHEAKLPKRPVLDEEPKASLYRALDEATKDTQKGSYGKIKHASELLKRLRPGTVAARCRSFKQFAEWLDQTIAGA
jgi:hypothetical protein